MILKDELMDDVCVGCGGASLKSDALGMSWCADCQYRGDFIDWGAAHGYPQMEAWPYAVWQGWYYWSMAVVMGEDVFIYTMLGAIEVLESEKEAS